MKKAKLLSIVIAIVLVLQVLVACAPAAVIEFPAATVNCVVGAKTVLKPTVKNGKTSDIVWSTSDKTIATVDGGKVVGVKVGKATITATIGKSNASVEVNVTTNQLDYADNTEIRMGVAHNSVSTTITYKDSKIVGEGLQLADGKTYHLNDLKPVWAELQKRLKVSFSNVYSGATSAQKEYLAWQAKAFEGVDVLVGNASDITVDGKNGKILDLNQYLPMMPNFYKFLQENPTVYMSLISDTTTGAMYYAPYFDGYDDIEKYFLMRTDWVEKLLNGAEAYSTPTGSLPELEQWDASKAQYTEYINATATTKIEVESLTKDGKGTQKIVKDYSKTNGKTAIDYINELGTGKVEGAKLVNAMRKYIDDMYGNTYDKRSNLFCGYDAAWDADELVALLRCVTSNSFGLTGENVQVTGLFPREITLDRTSDLLSLISMFGVRGTESRMDSLYFDSNGKLVDARTDPAFADAIAKLNALYDEGLILQNFTTMNPAKIADDMYKNNKGFMIYDYCQTQAVYNKNATVLAKCPEFNLAPVINPVAKWDDTADNVDNGKYFRFTESWRSVKTNGWCIPANVAANADKLAACLKMFDYTYSEEGNVLMSYGPDAWIEHDANGKMVTTNYKGKEVPKMSAAALDELWRLGKGNYTNYARQYTGASLPIGFIKDQGFEYQCTTDGGKEGAMKVSQAIALGVLKHVSPTFTTNTWYMMAPTALPTSKEDDDILALQTELVELFSKTKGKYNMWVNMIMVGYGGALTGQTHLTAVPANSADLIKYLNEKGAKAYLEIQNDAWNAIKKYYEEELKF